MVHRSDQLSVKQFDQVQDYIDKGVNEGAELFYGGLVNQKALIKVILHVQLFSSM